LKELLVAELTATLESVAWRTTLAPELEIEHPVKVTTPTPLDTHPEIVPEVPEEMARVTDDQSVVTIFPEESSTAT
jgi:hypothetical protein